MAGGSEASEEYHANADVHQASCLRSEYFPQEQKTSRAASSLLLPAPPLLCTLARLIRNVSFPAAGAGQRC
eukprot:614735-Hanusia_phi.AAC.2